jgi:hypothetical protein
MALGRSSSSVQNTMDNITDEYLRMIARNRNLDGSLTDLGERIFDAANRAIDTVSGTNRSMLEDLNYNISSWGGTEYASGTSYVPKTGIYKLHQGEAVVPSADNNGRNISIDLGGITVNGASNPEEIARQIVKPLQRELLRLNAIN